MVGCLQGLRAFVSWKTLFVEIQSLLQSSRVSTASYAIATPIVRLLLFLGTWRHRLDRQKDAVALDSAKMSRASRLESSSSSLGPK